MHSRLADSMFSRLSAELAGVTRLRERLHQRPELSGEESQTLETMLGELAGWPTSRLPGHCAVVVSDANPRPTVAIRAELDGLPIEEETDVGWRARNQAMHACGHDVHMAASVAVARTIAHFDGVPRLAVILQPREEQPPSGALDILQSGVLESHDVRAVVGVHVHPSLPADHVDVAAGAVNAAADTFTVTIHGRPGHGAYPHTTSDPVVTAAAVIAALQTVVSRRANPMNPTVLTIGSVHGGHSPNVVPATIELTGTLRTFDEAERVRLTGDIESICKRIAEAHDCRADVRFAVGDPPLVNDPGLVARSVPYLRAAHLATSAELRSCGSDDFAHYGRRFPTLMMFCGVGVGDAGPGLHHPAFLPDENDLAAVSRAMLAGYLGACEGLSLYTELRASKDTDELVS